MGRNDAGFVSEIPSSLLVSALWAAADPNDQRKGKVSVKISPPVSFRSAHSVVTVAA